MINKETVDLIINASRVEEVVGDFVQLKKRGANLLGLCPFHNEKTPSFTVSPVKGIYKCFGCGKAGNPVNFIMEHEHFTYPEALRYLAKKYNIEIAEEQREYSPQELLEQNEKESLFVISSHAQKYFAEQLWNTEEGKNIGLSYFRERGFSDETIRNFGLGYSPESRSAYCETALREGFKAEHLEGSGLGIKSETKHFDRFSGRVIFPIHSLSGRVLAFGARILRSDKKTAKYLNSPESPIYHKSQVLYGIFQSRKAISRLDNCFLVEGYTDVISLHQAGIENVVASSGTSLTIEQIRLIKRYTENITILYDGDPAGIKASLRGINMILEEGLHVRIVLFPEGEDPDSFAKKNGGEETREFLAAEAKDFIAFKTGLLLAEAGDDPLKKAALIRDIVGSIALIPDNIARSIYSKECAAQFDMDEMSIIHELNKLRKTLLESKKKQDIPDDLPPIPSEENEIIPGERIQAVEDILHQEFDLIRLMLTYGDKLIEETLEEEDAGKVQTIFLAHYVLEELQVDNLTFHDEAFRKIHEVYKAAYAKGEVPPLSQFLNHPDPQIARAAIDITSSPYAISPGWERHNIFVQNEDQHLHRAVTGAIYTLKNRHVEILKKQCADSLKAASEEALPEILQKIRELDQIRSLLNGALGRVIIR